MFNLSKNKKLKADYDELKKKYEEVIHREVQSEIELERLREVEKENTLINRLLEDHYIIGVTSNNPGEKQYVQMSNQNDSLTISLHNLHSKPPHTRLYAKINQDFNNKYRKTCELINIYSYNENSGDGTILLTYLFRYLKKRDVSEVKGSLSTTDKDRFDKLEYFYKKNGFKVSFNEDRTSGKITSTLWVDNRWSLFCEKVLIIKRRMVE